MEPTALERDAFFTPQPVADYIVRTLLERYPEWRQLKWFEPSAGGGAFIEAAKKHGLDVTGIDIHPLHPEVEKEDFLARLQPLSGQIIFGNPPYGNLNSLTRKFTKKAFEDGAHAVAFLLQASSIGIGLPRYANADIDHAETLPNVQYTMDGSVVSSGFGPSKFGSALIVLTPGFTEPDPLVSDGTPNEFDYFMSFLDYREKEEVDDTEFYRDPNTGDYVKHQPGNWYTNNARRPGGRKRARLVTVSDQRFYDNIHTWAALGSYTPNGTVMASSINYLLNIGLDRLNLICCPQWCAICNPKTGPAEKPIAASDEPEHHQLGSVST